MFAYRNLVYTSMFNDENKGRENAFEQLQPDEFLVLEQAPFNYWLCENDIIKNLRSNSQFFSFISDKRICELLLTLSKREYIERVFVQTDSEEEIKLKDSDNVPQAVIAVAAR